VYLGEDSKDYQFLSVLARALDDFSSLAVDAYNSRSPYYATGDSLDVLCTVVGITRRPAEYAEAVITVTGTDDTVIPAGSKVVGEDGITWSTTEDCTIASETGTVGVIRDEPGEVQLTEGFIDSIYDPIPGWTEVENFTVGTVGEDTESDTALRLRMLRALSSRPNTTYTSIQDSLAVLDDVTRVIVKTNDTSSTDEYSIPAHTINAVVEGGDADEIAKTIFNAKSPGIGTNGAVEKTIMDSYGNSTVIKFDRPTMSKVLPTIVGTVYNAQIDIPALKESIQNAIMEYINSFDIGDSLTINRLYAVIYSSVTASGFAVTNVTAAKGSGSAQTTEITCGWKERLYIDQISDIDVSGIVSA